MRRSSIEASPIPSVLLGASGLSPTTRIDFKSDLNRCGRLAPGKSVNNRVGADNQCAGSGNHKRPLKLTRLRSYSGTLPAGKRFAVVCLFEW